MVVINNVQSNNSSFIAMAVAIRYAYQSFQSDVVAVLTSNIMMFDWMIIAWMRKYCYETKLIKPAHNLCGPFYFYFYSYNQYEEPF